MKKLSIVTAILFAFATPAAAERIQAELVGYNEVPSISTAASGSLRAMISPDGQFIDYELSYANLQGDVQQAHIHIGQEHTNGGVSAFLCRTTQAPAAPMCPPSTATGVTVTGTIRASDVIGPGGQLVAPGEIDELVAAIRAGAAYANVHSSVAPGGEIRGQIRASRRP